MFFVFVFPEKKKAKNCDFPEIQFPLTVSLFSRTVKSDSPKNVSSRFFLVNQNHVVQQMQIDFQMNDKTVIMNRSVAEFILHYTLILY